MRAAIVILILLSLGLGGALLWRHNQAVQQAKTDLAEKVELTNSLVKLKDQYEEQEKLTLHLQKELSNRNQDLVSTSNSLVKVAADLSRTQKDAQAASEAAKAEMAKRDARIAELEGQKEALDKQAIDLRSAIGELEKGIVETEKKLAASEGDREFLLKELKRLQTEKAELERQFNDLSLLRTQVAKLKEELSIARRLEWIRMGIYGAQAQKGAERLLQTPPATQAGSPFNLNVELKQDGSASVVSGAVTNVAPKPPAPK